MKVGDSKKSSHSNKSEEKKEVKKDSPSTQDHKPTSTAQDKAKTQPKSQPKVSFQKDSFEASSTATKLNTAPKASAGNTLAASTTDKGVTDAAKALVADSTGKQVGGAADLLASKSTVKAAGTTVNALADATSPAAASTTEADAQAILEKGKNNPTEGADALAQKLTDPNVSQQEKEALVTSIIEQDPHTAAQILNEAGESFDPTGKLTDDERKAISQTVGQAWDHANPPGKSPATPGTPGTLDAADLRAVLSPNNMNAFPEFGAQPHNLGNVFAASGSSSLQHSAATQMYNIGKEIAAGNAVDGAQPDYVFKDTFANSYLAGSALAASGSPQAAQALMDHVARSGPDAVKDFVQRTSPIALSEAYGPNAENALGKLMQAVGNLPATPAADQFFDQAVAVATAQPESGPFNRHIGAEEAVAELQKGLGQYFQTNMEHTTTRWADSNQISDRSAYTHFAANVLFGDSFEGQKDLQTGFSAYIGKRAGELENVPVGDPSLEEKSRQLGFLIGGAEVGFQRALGRVQDRNATREAMVDFVFGIAEAAGDAATGGKIPNFKFGPIDVRGSITDGLKEQVYKWVREEEPDANEMTRPLYELGLSVDNDYQDEMQAVRGSFADDERYGYLD